MRVELVGKPEEISAFFAQKATQLEDAVNAAVYGSTEDIKKLGRVQVSAALSPRAANTYNARLYTDDRSNGRLGLVGYVYGRWWRKSAAGKPTDILAEYETGATIRPVRSEWLAIPIPATAGKFGLGLNSGRRVRLTPLSFERRTGLELRAIKRPGKNPLLVTDGTRAPQNILGKGRRFRKRVKGSKYTAWTPVFVLVKSSRLPKRLDFTDLAARAGPAKLSERLLHELGKRYG